MGVISRFDEASPGLPKWRANILLRSDSCGRNVPSEGENVWGMGHFEEDMESGQEMLPREVKDNPDLAGYILNGQAPPR